MKARYYCSVEEYTKPETGVLAATTSVLPIPSLKCVPSERTECIVFSPHNKNFKAHSSFHTTQRYAISNFSMLR